MTYHLFEYARRNRPLARCHQDDFGQFEQLEEKRCLAFLGVLNGTILEIDQSADDGNVLIDNSTGVWRATDNSGTYTFMAADNVEITLIDNTVNQLDLALDLPHAGDVTANLGNGARDMYFQGVQNEMGGDLWVQAGSGAQTVELAIVSSITIGGNATINLGAGDDRVDEDNNDISITGNLNLIGVNTFETGGTTTIGGDVIVDNSGEFVDSRFDDDATMSIGGSFHYLGGSGADNVLLNGTGGGTNIGGSATIVVGANLSATTQNIFLNTATSSVGGNLTVTSSAIQGVDNFLADAGVLFGGNIDIDLGEGANAATIVGVLGGGLVEYNGGGGNDNVELGTTGSPADVEINLGAGNDTFSLLAGTSILPTLLNVDFGGGGDTFNNLYGPFDFNANLVNLDGFNHNYDLSSDELVSTQLSDQGNLTIDNNGASGSLRFINGGINELTSAVSLTVNLIDGTNDLTVVLDGSGLAGDLRLNLGNGNRNVEFTGSNNSIGGDLEINAGSGEHNINIAVNNNLNVGGQLSVDLGSGSDVVDENGNDISVAGDAVLIGVNLLELNGATTIGGNLSFDTTGETQNSELDDDGSLTVLGSLVFTGGAGADEVLLNGTAGSGTSIGGNLVVNLGANVNGGNQNVFLNFHQTSIGGSVDVVSTDSTNSDIFLSDSGTSIGGDIVIDFVGGNNTASIVGVIGGDNVSYVAGNGDDTVSFGTTGNPVDVDVSLGPGNDTLTLLPGAVIAPTTVNFDFGGGMDVFNNSYGNFDFDALLSNLNGFTHSFNLSSNSLESTQVGPSGPVTIDNNGTSGAIRFLDGSISELTSVSELTVNMLNGSETNLNLVLDDVFAGDMSFNLGTGTRTMNFLGSTNSVDGMLELTAGPGAQTVQLSVNNPLSITGDVLIDLGENFDTIGEGGNGADFGGDLSLVGINALINNGPFIVAGDLNFDNTGDPVDSNLQNDGVLNIGGDLNYSGGSGRDVLSFNSIGAASLNGNVAIALGSNGSTGSQQVAFSDGVSIGGTLDVTSTSFGHPDLFTSTSGVSFGGDILINLNGGTNEVILRGVFGGSTVKYNGGAGSDSATYGLTGSPVNPNIKLNMGNDNFVLDSGVSIDEFLRVDFGGGVDTITNNFGAFTFDVRLLNWQGFNRFYDVDTDNLNLIQLEDTGDIILDNNGAGDAFRITNGAVTEMTSATDIRLVLMNNTSTDVTVDLDNSLAGRMTLQLRDGDRDVMFTGTNNSIGSLLRIEAHDGSQNIHLSETSTLNAANLVVNGREGIDVLTATTGVNVVDAMILRNMNDFANGSNVAVGGDFNFVTLNETEDTIWSNTGTITIGGNLTYLGGGGVDKVLFNSGAVTIGGFSYYDIASASDFFNNQQIVLNGYTAGRLQIRGLSSLGGNEVFASSSTNIAGDVILTFSDSGFSTNNITLLGNYGGTYSTYRGGFGIDNVVFGAVAPNAPFVAFLNAENDEFTMEASTDLLWTVIDFGAGIDTLVDNLGLPWPFPHTLLNL